METLARGLLGEYVAEGFQLVTLADDPAAGAEVAVTVPGRAAWRVLSVLVALVADATPVVRRPALVLDDQTTTYLTIPSAADQANTTTVTYNWSELLGYSIADATGLRQAMGMQGLTVQPGHRLRTVTTGLQAGDNYGRPVLLVHEVPERGPVAELAAELVALRERLADLDRAGGLAFAE